MKRFIIFAVLCVLFIVLGITVTDTSSNLFGLNEPFRLVGELLRDMSLSGSLLNALSVFLFLLISFVPLGYLVYKLVKKNVKVFEYVLLPLVSLSLGIAIYMYINPHILYQGIHPDVITMTAGSNMAELQMILTSGVAFLFYIMLLIYLSFVLYWNKKFDSIVLFKWLMDIIIVITALAVLYLSLSDTISQIKATVNEADKTVITIKFIGELVIAGLFVYLLQQFRNFIIELQKDGFHVKMLWLSRKLNHTSFILLVVTLGVQGFINLYQLLILDKIYNISFEFDIPIVTVLFVFIVFILSSYITRVIELKKENELII